MATQLKDKELTQQQELFCKYYASDVEFFGNGVKSYKKAYPDSSYASARRSASDFLTNPDILKRINQLLESDTLNDGFVDKQLAFLIAQNDEKPTKLGAIKEYNALKKRITQKIEVTTSEEQSLENIIKDLSDDPKNKLNNLHDDSAEAAPETSEPSS